MQAEDLIAQAKRENRFPHVSAIVMVRINPLKRMRLADPAFTVDLATYGRLHARLSWLETHYPDIPGSSIITAISDEQPELQRASDAGQTWQDSDLAGLSLPLYASEWLDVASSARRLEKRLAARQAAAVEAEGTRLIELARDPDLQRALALDNEVVRNSVAQYLEDHDHTHASPLGHPSAFHVLQCVARATAQISPQDGFTAVGLATRSSTGAGLKEVSVDGARSFASLDTPSLNYLLGGFQVQSTDPWLQQVPSVLEGPMSGQITFLRTRNSVTSQVSISHTDSVHSLLAATAMGPRRFSTVVADLESRLGVNAAAAQGLIDNALFAGLICLAPSGRECEGRLLGAALDLAPSEIADDMEAVRCDLQELSGSDTAERAKLLDRIRATGLALSRRIDRPIDIQVIENLMLPPRAVSLSGHTRQLGDLTKTLEFLSVFDHTHDLRALLGAAFVECYGSGGVVDLLECAELLVSKVNIRMRILNEDNALELGPPDGSLAALYRLRRRAREELHADIERASRRSQQGDIEVTWPADLLADLAADLPIGMRCGTLAYSVLVQTSGDRLILNAAYPGHGVLFGRYLECDRAMGGTTITDLSKELQAWYGDGARVVEDSGLHRLEVNRHAPVLPDRIGPDDWKGLRLAHFPETNTLNILSAHGERLNVIALGGAPPQRYPSPLRLATWLVAGGLLVPRLGSEWLRQKALFSAQAQISGISCPRLTAGDVVIGRRRWYLDTKTATELSSDRYPVHRLLKLARWRARYGVPDEVTLTQELGNTGPEESPSSVTEPYQRADGLPHEPQYVDMASLHFVEMLPKLLSRTKAFWIEESLPTVGESPHITEWAIGLARRSGEVFLYPEFPSC